MKNKKNNKFQFVKLNPLEKSDLLTKEEKYRYCKTFSKLKKKTFNKDMNFAFYLIQKIYKEYLMSEEKNMQNLKQLGIIGEDGKFLGYFIK